MTKVLVATGLYPPEIGGPATHTKLMEEHFPNHGIEVKVLPFSRVRFLPKIFRHVAYFTLVVFRAYNNADIIFAQDTVSVGVPSAIAAKILRKPFIVRVPGDYAWEQARQRFGVEDSIDDFQSKKYGWRVKVLRFFQRFTVQAATLVITPSEYFNSIVVGWGVHSHKVCTIYNGIDLKVVPRTPENFPQGKVMVSVGRFVPWKGFTTLINLLHSMPDWHLVIVGDGPIRSEIEKEAEELGVLARVTFTGSLSRDSMFGWLKAANVFVLNSSFESFSFQIAEAMVAGVPIVATNIGSIPELISNGKDGVLVAPDDKNAFKSAILSVMSEPEVWRRRTQAAREKAKQFSIDMTISKLSQKLKNV